MADFGLQIRKNGRLAMAPGFTPLVLVQVMDLAAGAKTVKTVVPAGRAFIAFHRRADASLIDGVFWNQTTVDGYVALNFSSDVSASTTTRVYIFSDMVVNVPNNGFYIYSGGRIVYHSSCLPLKMQFMDALNTVGPSPTPLAVVSAVTGQYYDWPSGDKIYWGYSRASAGYMTNQYSGRGDGYFVVGEDRYIENMTNTAVEAGFIPGQWNLDRIAYIDTSVYDTYYKIALGY